MAAARNETVLVAGATGRVGSRVIADLKAEGYDVRAITRDFDKAVAEFGADYQWVVADVRDPDTLKTAMSGVNKLVIAIGSRGQGEGDGPEQVDYGGVKNLVDAAKAAGVKYALLVSSGGVTHKDHPLNKMFNNLLIWKFKGEEYLRHSGITYTVFRPGGLRDKWKGGDYGVHFQQGDILNDGLIALDDVASVITDCIKSDACNNKTFEAFDYLALDPQSWHKDGLSALAKDK